MGFNSGFKWLILSLTESPGNAASGRFKYKKTQDKVNSPASLFLQEEKGRQRETNYEQLGDIVLEWEKETGHSSE